MMHNFMLCIPLIMSFGIKIKCKFGILSIVSSEEDEEDTQSKRGSDRGEERLQVADVDDVDDSMNRDSGQKV